MAISLSSSADLALVTDLMRNLSRKTDPEDAADLYATGLRKLNLFPNDRYLSLSRRNLKAPQFRITRCSTWKDHPNPWTEPEKIPLFSSGLLSEILYSNQPAIVHEVSQKVSKTDPAYEYLCDMNLLVSLPHFDGGESINAGILLCKDAGAFPLDSVPMMLWQANLWGRATLNLVTQQKLAAAYKSLDRELKVVGEIQRTLLPRNLPKIANVDIAAHYQTSQRAGGDYYDFFPLPDNQWGIFVADVSGHGTPAAVMMAVTHAIAHSRPGHPMPPGAVLAYLNNQLASLYTKDNGTFITALYGVLDAAARTLTFASAGHPQPRLLRDDASREVTVQTGYPLGLVADEQYPEATVQLRPGDKLLLYTDGIVESFRGQGDQFGDERLDAAALLPAENAQQVRDNILAALNGFTQNSALTDDRTLLAFLFD